MCSSDLELSRMLDDLVGRVWTLARQRRGRLAAIRLAIPGNSDRTLVTAALSERLEQAGLPDVELELELEATSPRILVVEFERWRA